MLYITFFMKNVIYNNMENSMEIELHQIVKCHLMFDDLIKLFLIKFSNFDVLTKYLIK